MNSTTYLPRKTPDRAGGSLKIEAIIEKLLADQELSKEERESAARSIVLVSQMKKLHECLHFEIRRIESETEAMLSNGTLLLDSGSIRLRPPKVDSVLTGIGV